MKLFQNFHRIFTFQISLMHRHIAHLADVVNGIDENLIIHIIHKAGIRHHFKDADTVVAGEGGIDQLYNELHALPGRGGADIRLRQRKLLRLTAVFI